MSLEEKVKELESELIHCKYMLNNTVEVLYNIYKLVGIQRDETLRLRVENLMVNNRR